MNKKIFAVAAMMLLMPMMMGAQALKGSYFLDNSLSRNRLNPAFAPDKGYLQLPVLGNLSFGLMSNLQVQDFLYPIDGQLYTFLNENVPVKKFERSLANKPHLDLATEIGLLNFGFFTGKSFWSFDLGLKVNADIDIPADLFLFMKKGTGMSGHYNIGAMKANVAANAYAAVGWSRNFYEYVPGLRVGAKVKAILPAAYAGINLNDVSLRTSPEKWELNAQGNLQTAVSGLDLQVSSEGVSTNFDAGQIGLSGFGMAFDLGAEYKMEFDGFINGVTFSASITDLGFIKYKADAVRAYSTHGNVEWSGLELSLEEGAMDGVMDGITEGFQSMIDNIEDAKESMKLVRSSLPSVYLGAEMPFLNNKMSVGALYSARSSFNYVRNELTLSYNLNPCKWFQLGLNYSFLNVSKTLGWILELTPKIGPSFYLGCDYLFFQFARLPENVGLPMLPMSMRMNFHFGTAFTIGGGKKRNAE